MITTSKGTTLDVLQENGGERYVLASNPGNPQDFQTVVIGRVVWNPALGFGFRQALDLPRELDLGPEVLRAIADLIDQETDRA